MRNGKIKVAEIFGPTIQGEGPLVGRPTLFVRTGGCDFRCTWCDSMHAVDQVKHGDSWEDLTGEEIFESLEGLSKGYPMLVSLSGGNPALQPLEYLIARGHELDYSFALETQGTVAREWFSSLDYLILSPKPPSSGMAFDVTKLSNCIDAGKGSARISFKVVVFDGDDYLFARDVHNFFPRIPMYLSAGTELLPANAFGGDENSRVIALRSDVCERTAWLVERAAADHWNNIRILPQLHVLLWGDKLGV